MNTDKKSIEAIEKVLGEPFACEYSDKAWKIRTNLLLSSVISMCVVFAGLEIDPTSEIFGIKFTGLNDDVIKIGLFVITTYLLIHFIWYSIDNILEWRLRITGTRTAFVTVGRIASDAGDYPNDPRQTTLYNWWFETGKGFGHISERSEVAIKELDEIIVLLKDKCTEHVNCANIISTINTIGNLREHVFKLTNEVTKTQKIFESNRVPASLKRFDRWYMYMLRSNNLRFIIIDFGFPVMAGIFALITLRIL